jgi:hypothetical protein
VHTGNPHLSDVTKWYTLPSGDFSDGQHLFTLEWLPHAFKWYVDGVLVKQHNTWTSSGGASPAPYDGPFYLIFETALGGTWPGATDGTTTYPGTLEVDYVKYYKYSAPPQILTPATTYRDKVMALNPIAYWPLWEPAGTTSIDDQTATGAITAVKNMTLGQTGIGDGRTSIKGNGTTSSVLVYTASSADLNTAFKGASGSLVIWAKAAAAGTWTGATYERLMQIRADDNNRILILRYGGANNQLIVEYHAGGTTNAAYPDLGGTLNWFNIIVTWDKAANQVKVYVNGTQSGATLTGLGTWAGALDNWTSCLGSSSYNPDDVWAGWLAHAQLYDYALSQAQINTIASV